jgi:hypothetical protein
MIRSITHRNNATSVSDLGIALAVTWTAGLPKEPASTTLPGFLKIVDHHHFRAGNSRWNDMTFVRVDDRRSR